METISSAELIKPIQPKTLEAARLKAAGVQQLFRESGRCLVPSLHWWRRVGVRRCLPLTFERVRMKH